MKIVDRILSGEAWQVVMNVNAHSLEEVLEDREVAPLSREDIFEMRKCHVLRINDVSKMAEEMSAKDLNQIPLREISLRPPFESIIMEFSIGEGATEVAVYVSYLLRRDGGYNISCCDYLSLRGERPITSGGFTVHCDSEGNPNWNLSRYNHPIDVMRHLKGLAPRRPFIEQSYASIVLVPIVLALQLLNCKNVKAAECKCDPKLARRYEKRHGYKRPRYYVLDIEPMKQKFRDANGGKDGIALSKALHICRGHFKNFDEKPLFGKLRGNYWWPAHVRGTAEAGIVDKDYRIKVGSDDDKGTP